MSLDVVTLGKVKKLSNPGAENVGRFLGVNSNGETVPMSIGAGQIIVDPSLATAGAAADAKAAGNAIMANSAAVGELKEDIADLNATINGARLNLIPPYTRWNWQNQGIDSGDIQDDSMHLSLIRGNFAYGHKVPLSDVHLTAGSHIYAAVKDFVSDTMKVNFTILFYNASGAEISRVNDADNRAFTYVDAVIPDNTTTIGIRFASTKATMMNVAGCYLSNKPFDESTVFTWNPESLISAFELLQKDVANNKKVLNSLGVVYVSPTGNDANNGTYDKPYRTILRALSASNNVVLMGGRYSGETIDTSVYDYPAINIKGIEEQNVIIDFGNSHLVDNGSEVLVSGYTKVYSVPCAENPFPDTFRTARMYQDYVADVSTVIPNKDRHPLNKGMQHRCDSTLIKQCDSVDAIEALPENTYGFFWSSGLMYFSRPERSSTNHPIVIPTLGKLFVYQYTSRPQKRQLAVNLSNLEIRYAGIMLSYSAHSTLTDVRVKYPLVNVGGCFYLYCVSDTTLAKCEACGTTNGNTNGDGINVDTHDTAGLDDALSLSLTLRDCWSHDNNDDGYSDHDRSEVIVEGGLYEYNGKGGITPAYGANDVIRSAISRYNRGSGILATGNPTASNLRRGTVVSAFDCICYGQTNGFCTDYSECMIQAINCVSFENKTGFNASNGAIYAIHCSSDDVNTSTGNVYVHACNALT